MAIKISVTSTHSGGNILLSQTPTITTSNSLAKATVTLRIRPDVYTDLEKISHMQYFSFRSFVSGLGEEVKVISVQYIIENASDVSYPEAWPGTTICHSSKSLDARDDGYWKRNLSTKYSDGKLSWTHVHNDNGSTFFSYWPPYTYSRHLKLISDCCCVISSRTLSQYSPVVESLGQSLQGREMECIAIGSGSLTAWIIHRQHPGETMAEFFAEGLLHRLLGVGADGSLDEATKRILEQYRLYILPCMCPDGAVMGHLRTNSVGANLNREWATKEEYVAPTLERSPEVYAVLNKMDETGVDFFLDVHGDEELPYVFLSGAEKTPKWSMRMQALHGYFVASYQRANTDVQKEIGYPPPESEEKALEYMNVGTNQVSNRFDCLGLTLEMPYKDCATNPDPDAGFSPLRAIKLGRDLIEALDCMHPYLRAEGEFWSAFGEGDGYVEPTDDYKAEGFVMLKKRFYSDVRPHDQ
jgi:murein tripeptide amidase MpaA